MPGTWQKKKTVLLFENELAELVQLKKEETEILGYKDHPYDALMDEFEKGCTVGLMDKFSVTCVPATGIFWKKFSRKTTRGSFLFKSFDKKKQWDFGMQMIWELGFDFEAGRQDLSSHPFSTSFNK